MNIQGEGTVLSTDDNFYYDLYSSLGFLAQACSRLMNSHLTRQFRDYGLDITPEQWNILVQLWIKDEQSQQQLASTLMLDASTMSRTLDGLEKRKLIIRNKGEDSRFNYICLTDITKSSRDATMGMGQQVLKTAQAQIPAEDLAICRAVLFKMCRNLLAAKPATGNKVQD